MRNVSLSDLSPHCQSLFKKLWGFRAALRDLSAALGEAEVAAWEALREERPDLPEQVMVLYSTLPGVLQIGSEDASS